MPETSSPGSEIKYTSGESLSGHNPDFLAALEKLRLEAEARQAEQVQLPVSDSPEGETDSPEGGVGVSDTEPTTATSPESGAPEPDSVPAPESTPAPESVASADQTAAETVVPEWEPKVGKKELVVPEAVQAEMDTLLQGLTAKEIQASITSLFFDSGLARNKAVKDQEGKIRARITVFKDDADELRYLAARRYHKRALLLEQAAAKKNNAQANRLKRPPKAAATESAAPVDEIQDTPEDQLVSDTPEAPPATSTEPGDTSEPTPPNSPDEPETRIVTDPLDHSDLRRAIGSYTGESAVQRTRNRYADRRDLVERFGQKGDGRPEMSPHVYEQAMAENTDMGFAAAQLKNGHIEAARESVAKAHARGEEAAVASRERMSTALSNAQIVRRNVQEAVNAHEGHAIDLAVTGDMATDAAAGKELGALIGRNVEPSVVIRRKDQARGFEYTDFVYETSTSKNIAFVERFTADGALLGRMVVTTKEQAFKPKRFGRGVQLGREVGDRVSKPYTGNAPDKRDFSDVKAAVKQDRRQRLATKLRRVTSATTRPIFARLGLADAKPRPTSADRPTVGSKVTYDPVRQSLESAGYDAVTADVIARRRKRKN